jgi:alkanesulfonate monooxygenase SsuD/methylene tetrahydromethanopterin reductase-like flavin-dependent oxidoreductase (luciferase family)
MVQRQVLFGASLGQWNGADIGNVAGVLELATTADANGLDLFTVADHLYFGDRLDAYTTVGFALGRTSHIAGLVAVTCMPTRPAPLVARAITSLSALSGGRVVLGIGAGFIWDMITKLGVPQLTPGAAVRAMEEAITLIKALCGGPDPVTFDGDFYQVYGLDPAPVPAPPVWTGSVGPRSLAVTGRAADGWVPSMGSDWLSKLYRESRPKIDEAAAAVGRDPSAIVDIFNFGGVITPSPLIQTRGEDGRWVGGSPAQWIEEMTSAVIDHGAGGFVFRSTDETTPAPAAVARFAQEIVPAVREAISGT